MLPAPCALHDASGHACGLIYSWREHIYTHTTRAKNWVKLKNNHRLHPKAPRAISPGPKREIEIKESDLILSILNVALTYFILGCKTIHQRTYGLPLGSIPRSPRGWFFRSQVRFHRSGCWSRFYPGAKNMQNHNLGLEMVHSISKTLGMVQIGVLGPARFFRVQFLVAESALLRPNQRGPVGSRRTTLRTKFHP